MCPSSQSPQLISGPDQVCTHMKNVLYTVYVKSAQMDATFLCIQTRFKADYSSLVSLFIVLRAPLPPPSPYSWYTHGIHCTILYLFVVRLV